MPVYWTLFALFCAGHLTACFFEWERIRKISKVGIVPLLMVGLLISRTNEPLLLLGLLFGWIGDIFMIFDRRDRCFLCGTGFFVLGHFSYIAATLQLFFATRRLGDIPTYLWPIFVLMAAALFCAARWIVSKHIGAIAYLGASYFSVLAAALLLSLVARRYILAIAFGLFALSDGTLSVCRFGKTVRREHFYIMSSYILAQALICVSFIYG